MCTERANSSYHGTLKVVPPNHHTFAYLRREYETFYTKAKLLDPQFGTLARKSETMSEFIKIFSPLQAIPTLENYFRKDWQGPTKGTPYLGGIAHVARATPGAFALNIRKVSKQSIAENPENPP